MVEWDSKVLAPLVSGALTAAIPSYGNFGGRGWEGDQGRDPSEALNLWISIQRSMIKNTEIRDFPTSNKTWVYRNYSSVPADQVAPGLFGVAYVLEGEVPFFYLQIK